MSGATYCHISCKGSAGQNITENNFVHTKGIYIIVLETKNKGNFCSGVMKKKQVMNNLKCESV